jgi:hypothetical protein
VPFLFVTSQSLLMGLISAFSDSSHCIRCTSQSDIVVCMQLVPDSRASIQGYIGTLSFGGRCTMTS